MWLRDFLGKIEELSEEERVDLCKRFESFHDPLRAKFFFKLTDGELNQPKYVPDLAVRKILLDAMSQGILPFCFFLWGYHCFCRLSLSVFLTVVFPTLCRISPWILPRLCWVSAQVPFWLLSGCRYAP